jgi:ATP-dependent protease HslVU (ClpYQ), peptidase subunit
MTCIVGLADRGTVWIGRDSAGTSDSGIQTIHTDRKVFLLNPPDQPEYNEKKPTIAMGGTTSYRFLDLLQYKLEVPLYDPTMPPKKYLVTAFVDAIRACLKSSGYDKKDEGEEQGGVCILGWQGKLYHIFDDYQVGEPIIGYHAVGGGASIALGAMFATQNQDLSPENRIQIALQAAAMICSSVRPPFIIEKIESKAAHIP